MKFEFKPSFKRSIKSLPDKEKEEIKEAAIHVIDMLSQEQSVHKGIGLKRLRGDFWELRKGIKARILFRWEGFFHDRNIFRQKGARDPQARLQGRYEKHLG